MRLGIDASNIRSGGGVTHLVELLRTADPSAHGFTEVVVWASSATLSRLDDRPWLMKHHDSTLEKNYIHRALWQRNRLGLLAKEERCDLLFVPGGSFVTDFRPVNGWETQLPFRTDKRFFMHQDHKGVRKISAMQHPAVFSMFRLISTSGKLPKQYHNSRHVVGWIWGEKEMLFDDC